MADPAASSDLATAGVIGGVVTVLGALGQGIRWLFSRADRRAADLDRKEAELVAKLEARVAALEVENRKIWTALSFAIPALHHADPTNPALAMIAEALGDMYPVPHVRPSNP